MKLLHHNSLGLTPPVKFSTHVQYTRSLQFKNKTSNTQKEG